MTFLLNPQYALRGWLKMPRVLFNIEENRAIRNLTLEQFLVLQSCDGEHDLKINGVLQKFLDEGIVAQNGENKNLKEEQKYYCFSNRYFKIVQWAITGRCNYRCKHCFMAKDLGNCTDEFSTDECLDIVNQIADCGIEEVYITGGEPLIDKSKEQADSIILHTDQVSVYASKSLFNIHKSYNIIHLMPRVAHQIIQL